jgi:general secretion pathway protein K
MRTRAGFALIAALWLLVALAAIGLQFSLQGRERRLAAGNVLEEVRTRAAAEAGLAHARARLYQRVREAEALQGVVDPRLLADPWGGLDVVLAGPVDLGDVHYQVTLRDASAALNVNRATEDELRRLLGGLRVDHGRADEIAQSVMDWRDPDDLPRPRGAEMDYYLRRESPVLPRNGPFESLAELIHVRGMTPEILDRVTPYLTLVGTGRVNLNVAEPVVLATLPGMTDETIGVILRHRQQGRRIGNLLELADQLSPGARALLQAELPRLLSATTMESREVEVRVEGWADGGRVRSRLDALLVRSGSTIYVVWRRAR